MKAEGNHVMRFRLSINRYIPGQKLGIGDGRWGRYNGSFQPEIHSAKSLLDEVEQGHGFCALQGGCQLEHCGQWCCPERKGDLGHCGRPKGYRANRHWTEAQHIGLDFDNGDTRSSLDYLLNVPLIAQHASFVYTTLSHTPECPKARVVFVTDVPFTDADYYRRAKRAVMAALPWGDASVHDPSRFFYGTNPKSGTTKYLGGLLPLETVDGLIERHREHLELEQGARAMPRIPTSQVLGRTPAERYVNTAIQQEVAWLASRVEGTGERHRGLLLAALKLGSLKQSEWLSAQVRNSIDPLESLLTAAHRNGYVEKYGEEAARRTIADGVAYSKSRQKPSSWNSSGGRRTWSGGQWVKSVTV
mgnify:CR=1 FL=1